MDPFPDLRLLPDPTMQNTHDHTDLSPAGEGSLGPHEVPIFSSGEALTGHPNVDIECSPFFRTEHYSEADVSASQQEAPQGAWVPLSDANPRRQERTQPSASEGTLPIVRRDPQEVTDPVPLGSPSARARKQRFPKERRLRKRYQYLLVQERGRRIHLRDLLAIVHPHAGEARVGITASSKVGGAVVRNRVKRLIREVWRRNRETLPDGYDVVFVAKRTAALCSFRDLSLQLTELGRRLIRTEGRQGRCGPR